MLKSRDGARDWLVYTDVIDGSLDFLRLNTTGAKQDSGLPAVADSNVFYAGGSDINTSGEDIIAYCFAPVEGYSAMGKYTGNGSADGPFVYTGFRPRWIMWKRTDSADIWFIYDTARNTYNVMDKFLEPHTANAEGTYSNGVDYTANGFKIRNTASSYNASGGTYIYAAFASNPFASNGGLAR